MGESAPSTRWVIGLDADDTLWDNQEMFEAAEELHRQLLQPWATAEQVNEALLHEERQTLPIYGYGVKGFVLAMITTAIEVSNSQISHANIERLISCGKDILHAPVAFLPDVPATVPILADRFDLLLITKGDLHHQNRKIAQSGLLQHLRGAEVVDEKDPDTYQRVLDRHGVDAQRFIMVGNSVRSDIEPVLAIGGRAIHIPYHLTWELERPSVRDEAATRHEHHYEIARFGDLPDTLAKLTADEEAQA